MAVLFDFSNPRDAFASISKDTKPYCRDLSFALVSFALCLYYSIAEPSSAFYLLPQRAWELLAGGIVALQFKNEQQKYSNILIVIGLIFIFVPIAIYDQFMPWPYYWGLFPVAGTCFVIAANRPNALIFRNPLLQITGKWSYSIYLWHWPVSVAALYFGFMKTTAFKISCEILILAAIIVSGGLLLALARRLLAEKLLQPRLLRLLAGGGVLALTLMFASTVTVFQGMPDRRQDTERQKLAMYDRAAHDWSFPDECSGRDTQGKLRPCQLGPDTGRGTLFLGDSYTMQIYSRFVENAKLNPESSFTFLATAACPPLTGVRIIHDRFNCNGFVDEVLDYIKTKNFKRIVLVSNWYAYFYLPVRNVCFVEGDNCTLRQDPDWFLKHLDGAFASLREHLLPFKERGTEIVIVGATPSSRWDVPVELAKRRFWGGDTKEVEYIDRNEFETKSAATKSRLVTLASSLGSKFVDPLDFLCEADRCPTVDKDGVPYFRDEGHFRSGAVKTTRFQFLDDAAGVNNRLSAAAMPTRAMP